MSLTETKLQVLAEHYKNTFDILQDSLRKRDRLFLGVLCILIVMLFQIYTPQEASNLIEQFISEKLNIKTQINFLFIQSLIWFGLLSITLKYFQAVIAIERQYNYIHGLEKQLSNEYGQEAFTREGVAYLKDYPIFLNWVSFLYTIFFPTLLLIISSARIFSECRTVGFKTLLVWFNMAIFLFIVISVVLYLIVLFRRKKETD